MPELPRSLRVATAWLEQIRAATGAEPDQATVDRVTSDCHWDRPCGDCAAEIGQPHTDGCDVARCMWTGEQRIQCDGLDGHCNCEDDNGYDPDGYTIHTCGQVPHGCGSQIWDGMWPGTDVGVEHGLYSYFDGGWHECGPEHPQASPDLSCWRQLADWDRGRGQWTLDPKQTAYLHSRRARLIFESGATMTELLRGVSRPRAAQHPYTKVGPISRRPPWATPSSLLRKRPSPMCARRRSANCSR